MKRPFEAKAPIEFANKHIVEIHMNGAFWDHREFDTKEEAEAFHADPLAADRKREQKRATERESREEEEAKYRGFAMERISTGRKIAPKPGR